MSYGIRQEPYSPKNEQEGAKRGASSDRTPVAPTRLFLLLLSQHLLAKALEFIFDLLQRHGALLGRSLNHYRNFACLNIRVLHMFPLSRGRRRAPVSFAGGSGMVARVSTVAFEGVEARPIDVQVQIAPGNVAFMIVGLGDKAVAESRERVRAALIASGLALPARRITVNLAPADMPKEGSHYDLPIALGVMAAIGAIPAGCAARLRRDRRTGARRHGERGRRRAAGRDRRQRARARADLPCRLRAGGGLGVGRSRHSGAALADPARQSLQGDAGAQPADARHARARRAAARHPRHQAARKAPSARSKWPPPAATIC